MRRACRVLRAERSSYHYCGCRADPAKLKKRVREMAKTRVRYGYRRIHVLLRREGWDVNASVFIGATRSWGCSCGTSRSSAG